MFEPLEHTIRVRRQGLSSFAWRMGTTYTLPQTSGLSDWMYGWLDSIRRPHRS
jgi:hypothetical protein